MAIDAKMSMLSKAEKKLSTEITAFDMNRVLSIMADLMQEYEVKERVCVADIDDDLVECYFDSMAVRGYSKKTMRNYRMYLRDMMEYLKVPIRQIMVYHLRNYLSKKKQDGLMESSLSHRRSVMSSFFRMAAQGGTDRKESCEQPGNDQGAEEKEGTVHGHRHRKDEGRMRKTAG